MITFAALRYGTTVYECDGLELDPQKYEVRLSPAEDADARRVVAFQAHLDTLNCRLRWHGSPQRACA